MRNTSSNWEAFHTACALAHRLPPDVEFVILHYLRHPLGRISLSVDCDTALEAKLLRETLGPGIEWDIRADTMSDSRVRTVWSYHTRSILVSVVHSEASASEVEA